MRRLVPAYGSAGALAIGRVSAHTVRMTEDRHRRSAQASRIEYKAVVPVLLLVAAGALLRFWSIDSRGLWLDEAVTILHARFALPDVIKNVAYGVHPPLFHILMHFWISAMGTSEVIVRTYATIWGLLSIPASYWAARSLFDRRTGLIAATITAFSPYLIWYSQEARMYSMMLFFSFVSIGFLIRAVRLNRPRDWVGYTVATLLGMFTHYFYAFLVLGQGMYFVAAEILLAHHVAVSEGRSVFTWRHPRTAFIELPKLKPWLISTSVLVASYALWLSRSIFVNPGENALVASATGQGLGYGQVPPSIALRFNDVGAVVVQMLMGFHTKPFEYAMIAAWPLVISVTLILFDHMEDLARKSAIALWSATGLLVVSLLGQWQGQVLASRYYIPLAAPVVILVAGVLGSLPVNRRRIIMALGIALSLAAWGSQSYGSTNYLHFEYREAIAHINEGRQPGDIVVYEPFYMDPVVMYYLPDTIPSYAFPQFQDEVNVRRSKADLNEDLTRVVGPAKRAWLLLSFQDVAAVRQDAENTMEWFEANGFELIEDREYNWARVLLYESRYPLRPLDMMEVAP